MSVLAVQNLEATSELAKEQMVEWTALQGSLATMSKGVSLSSPSYIVLISWLVLNDILDFNRLDSGRFSTVQQPYKLVSNHHSAVSNRGIIFVQHQAIRSLITPLHLTAANRGLSLVTTLDPEIDEV